MFAKSPLRANFAGDEYVQYGAKSHGLRGRSWMQEDYDWDSIAKIG